MVSPRLRALHPLVAETLEVAQQWSPTVRSLTEALEQSNLIVHIVPQPMGCRSSGALHRLDMVCRSNTKPTAIRIGRLVYREVAAQLSNR